MFKVDIIAIVFHRSLLLHTDKHSIVEYIYEIGMKYFCYVLMK